VLHGNEDNQKDEVRKDTQAPRFIAIRILLTFAALHKFQIASLDIKGAYLQSGPCKRYVFVRPPNEWPRARGVVWKLLKLRHGLPDACHKWQVVIDDFLFVLDFTIIPQLFLHRTVSNKIDQVVAKVKDDILIGVSSSVTALFVQQLKSQFDVGRVVVNDNMHLNGSFISVSADGYTLDISEPLSRIQPIALEDFHRT
jgi:Reverse transcriptase (RNA-dependent DNA polymerase)